MALIKCKECGKEISSNATVCPGCGYKNINESEKAPFGVLAICFFIPIVGFILFAINTSIKKRYAEQCLKASLLSIMFILLAFVLFVFLTETDSIIILK